MVGRPETHPVKKIIGFTEEMIEAVENWRAKQRPVPNLSEALGGWSSWVCGPRNSGAPVVDDAETGGRRIDPQHAAGP